MKAILKTLLIIVLVFFFLGVLPTIYPPFLSVIILLGIIGWFMVDHSNDCNCNDEDDF